MPSLNLRNVLRRNPNRPSLRDRAAALKIAAGLVIRPPKSEVVSTTAPVEAGAILDRILIFRVQELVAIEASQDLVLKVTSFADAYDSPDWVRMEGDREKTLAQVIATRAHTMEGVTAKASSSTWRASRTSRSRSTGCRNRSRLMWPPSVSCRDRSRRHRRRRATSTPRYPSAHPAAGLRLDPRGASVR